MQRAVTRRALVWFAILLLGTFLLTRSIVIPVRRFTESLKRLLADNIEAAVAGLDRGEFGTIVRVVEEVRETARSQMMERLGQEGETAEQETARACRRGGHQVDRRGDQTDF